MTIAVVVGALAFAFRYLTVRDFTNDHYMYLAWAQQLLAGEFPGRDFVDPGMPLAYSLSALAQAVFPGPFSETILTVTLLSAAAALLSFTVAELTGSLWAGLAAALFSIGLQPRLYNYPKILVPAVTLFVLQRYLARPSRWRLTALGVWTVVAAMFRYDLGIYVGVAVLATLLAAHRRDVAAVVHASTGYVAATVMGFLPYAVFVHWSVGLREHFEETFEFARGEAHQLQFAWPDVPLIGAGTPTWNYEASAAYLFYVAYALLIAVPVAIAFGGRKQPRDRVPVAVATLALLACYVAVMLRHPVEARVADLAAVIAAAGAFVVVQFGRTFAAVVAAKRPVLIAFAGLMQAIALAATAAAALSVSVLAKVPEQLRDTRVADGWAKVAERSTAVRARGSIWPWNGYWPSGDLPDAIEYLAACTSPLDRVLLTWPAPEYYYFSRRPFAAGHALLLPPRAFTGAKHQQRMLARLERQFVPLILINQDRRGEFERAYPLLAAYINERYIVSGVFTIYDGAEIAIAHRLDLQPTSTYGPAQWPCNFEPPLQPTVPAHPEA